MFYDPESTENDYNALHERGYSKDHINLVMSDETRNPHFKKDVAESTEIRTKAAKYAGKGSAIVGFAGDGLGGIAGGLIGDLVGSCIPEARAKLYESGIKEGNVVISITPRNNEDAEYLKNNWKNNRDEEIHW